MELVARHADEPPPVGIELLLTVAEEQGLRGAKAFDASALRSDCGFVLDHAGAGRRGDRRHADPAEDPRRLHRGRGARRDSARGRQQRDRRRRGGDRPDGAGPARRGDDRQRRPDLRAGPRATSSPATAGSIAEARSLDAERPAEVAGDDHRRLRLGRRASTAATSTCGSRSCSAATRCRRPRRRWRWPRRACARAGLEPRGSRSAAAATPTPCASAASTASCSPTAPRRYHTPDESVSARSLDAMLEVCEADRRRGGAAAG